MAIYLVGDEQELFSSSRTFLDMISTTYYVQGEKKKVHNFAFTGSISYASNPSSSQPSSPSSCYLWPVVRVYNFASQLNQTIFHSQALRVPESLSSTQKSEKFWNSSRLLAIKRLRLRLSLNISSWP